MCRACNHPAYDGEPTCRDITAADVPILAPTKQPHDVNTCDVRDCWNCRHWHGIERVIDETEREQQYDADEAERWAS
ncbi:hypothetical protein NSI01_54950 [Pimelobacter simplex]|nr:hypothetical protein NSI01_54950 [Pimelobacter simplex]